MYIIECVAYNVYETLLISLWFYNKPVGDCLLETQYKKMCPTFSYMVTYRSVLETVTNRKKFKWLLTVRVVTKKPNMFEKNLMLNLDSVILEVKCPMGPLHWDDLFPSFDIYYKDFWVFLTMKQHWSICINHLTDLSSKFPSISPIRCHITIQKACGFV